MSTSTIRTRDRIIALTIAIFFFIVACGFSGLVIWQVIAENKQNKDSLMTTPTPTNQLKGTKLAGFTPLEDIPKLTSTDTKVGAGKEAKAGDKVTVNYTGALAATGVIFESSLDSGKPIDAQLVKEALIAGWVEGVPGMKEGGTRRLLIPAVKAYDKKPPAGIPVDADLVFDIELIKVGS